MVTCSRASAVSAALANAGNSTAPVVVVARRDQRGGHLAVVLDEGDVALAGRRGRDRDPERRAGMRRTG